MATVINDPGCVLTAFSNTGKPDCDLKPSQFVGAILIPRGSHYSVANVADIVTILAAQTLLPVGSRAYPVWEFVEIKDNSEAPVKVTTGYGEETTTRSGKYKWDFKLNNTTGLMWWANMRTFHQSNSFDVLFIDDNNTIWGKKGPTTGELMGLGIGTIEVNDWKAADGAKPAEFWLTLNLSDPRDLNENVAYIKPATSVKDSVKGIINITLTTGGTVAANTWKIIAKTTIGNIDLYPAYATLLEAHTAWIGHVSTTGVAVTVSEVAASGVFGGWTITTSDAPTGTIHWSLNTPVILAALGIGGTPDEGIESDTLTLVVP
jgi:hypothetical protein